MKSIFLTMALMVVGLASAPAAQMIVNGSFLANAAGYITFPGYNGGTNPASISSWTGFPDEGGKGLNGSATTAGTPFAPTNSGGNTYAFVQGGGGAIYQPIALAANTAYTLSIDIAGRAGDAAPLFSVEFADSATPFAPFWVNGGLGATLPGNQAAFTNYTFTFTTPAVLGPATLIELWNRSPAGDNTVDFANVSVVPEPSSLALLAGLGLALGRRSRRPSV